MRRLVLIPILTALLAAMPGAPPAYAAGTKAPSTKAAATREHGDNAAPADTVKAGLEFPPNEAGGHAKAWFQAFNEGEPAMRKYLQAHVAPAGLARRSLEDRIEIYRDLKDERGTVTPLKVESFTASDVKAIARGARGGRFAITFHCEEEAPHGLLGIQIEDLPPEEGTPEGVEDGGYSAAPAGPPMSAARVAASLRAYVDSLTRADAFSGAVLLARKDQVLVRQAYGQASRRYGTPNRPDTKFNLGSINKAFTKLAIDQLAQQGKLSLDDTIDRYLPDYPREKGSKITIRMLVDHRGGVPDIFGPKYQIADRTSFRTVSDWVALIADQPLRFDPGTREEYSNGGYVLLGAIVEKVSGLSYYDYVRRHIYEPAGMKDTDSYEQDDPIRNLAAGYTRRRGAGTDGRWRDSFPTLPGRGSPAGGGYSTVDDLFRFAQALRSGKLGNGREGGMAIAGGSPGTNAMLMMQGDWTLVVLANQDPPSAERIGMHAGSWLRRAGAPDMRGHRVSAADVSAGGEPVEKRISARPLGGGGDAAMGGNRAERNAPDAQDRHERPQATRVPRPGVEVPMSWAGHLASVSVMLNGQGPFRFAIDTGAGGCARIDAAVASRLGLPVVGEAQVGDPSGKNLKSASIVSIDSLEIGGARFAGLTASTGDLHGRLPGEPVDGILGFGLFADCLVTLDFPALRLRLSNESVADGTDAIPFQDTRGIPSITMRVAGTDVDTDVDAGAMGGISLPQALASKLPLAEPPRVVGHARTVSNEFDIQAARLDGDVTLGGITFTKPMVEFQPIFPVGNLGARVLRNYAVTFDTRHHRMTLQPAAGGGDGGSAGAQFH